MVINPSQLLKRLEPSIRPSHADQTFSEPSAPFDAQAFDQMLALVSRGKVQGRPVEVKFEMDPPLAEDDHQRIAAAADLAEASGARTALLLFDGRGMLLDVGARALTSELNAVGRPAIVQIDAAVYVAGEEINDRNVVLPGRGIPGASLLPPSVAQRLEQLDNTMKTSLAE